MYKTKFPNSIWLGAPKKTIYSLGQRLSALKPFYSLKKPFNVNKLSDGLGSQTVLNKDLHICEYAKYYFKLFIKLYATDCLLKVKSFYHRTHIISPPSLWEDML